ncbi:DUF2147 domain-containing protein [Rhizobium laguerreae]|jgi:uncharacterized protein (DUF2147 family)|nr:DUF2147 domain-containing protein [Rhizobium laguerreae]MBY3136726.1 DUF2147 domain-containing protein [Rhizobium laguerreae]MBY3193178.1 DUF2147 domain-containing protein [Rhizobium laguerreae]MBY3224319.1 DUF2147 domain-containing protein [Rhizobium laguerreae]MBY3232665.1 DUF2147 domain-containing protein [Rhizobium laguerreae]MBY3447914.1 DUF2147 domain-containing protein [Rhizobium laguerreae]
MVKSLMGLLLAAVLSAGMAGLPVGEAFAQASSPDQIVGVWESEDGNLKLEMFDAGETYAARVLYGKLLVEADGKTFKKDTLNPDPNLRSRSLERAVLVTNLKWDAADGRWEGGNFYSGATGQTHSARATLVSGKLELRAYRGTTLLGRTMVLRRAQ